jgi:outer membrane cobalamin receptor
MKIFLCVLFLFTQFLSAQEIDSTKADPQIYPDSLKTTNTTTLIDTSKQAAKIDTLKPIYQSALSSEGYFINRRDIVRMDYRNAGDLFAKFPFDFTRDFGFIGRPNETVLYGAGFGGISFLENGVLFNNRLSNSLDLNLIQTESIDSIEIVPSTRGFLYSPYNNPVSVNIINRDFLSRPAYSRIKYYQGPFGEAMVDGSFNAWLYKKLDVSFDITNRKTDDRYTNSIYSLWQSRLKIKYLLSDKINVIGSFYYVTSKTGLNGGVDLSQITGDPAAVIYDELLAPVVYFDRMEQTRQQNFSLKFLGRLMENSETDLTFYYKSLFDGITEGSDSTYIANTGRSDVFGLHLRHDIMFDVLNLTILGNYEKSKLNYDWLSYNSHRVNSFDFSAYSAAAILTFNTNTKIFMPSLFYKISHNSYYPSNNTSRGLGVDVKINLLSDFSLYAGYSFYNNPGYGKDAQNFETSVEYNNGIIIAGAKYFSRKDYYDHSMSWLKSSTTGPVHFDPVFYSNMNGFGGQINFQFWKLIVENNGAYYFNSDNSRQEISLVPKYTYRGGLFYRDSLFSGNLDLKAGFVFYYNGKRKAIKNTQYTQIVDANNRLDFTLTGEIQKVAMIYFTWQNLLNNKYFVVPYYPMPARSIRFGITWEFFN